MNAPSENQAKPPTSTFDITEWERPDVIEKVRELQSLLPLGTRLTLTKENESDSVEKIVSKMISDQVKASSADLGQMEPTRQEIGMDPTYESLLTRIAIAFNTTVDKLTPQLMEDKLAKRRIERKAAYEQKTGGPYQTPSQISDAERNKAEDALARLASLRLSDR
jgi:hypothetical protein